MEKKLIEVAKELNIGKESIVDYLTAKGFEIENRPIAKVSDVMYDALVKNFQESLSEKKKAEQLNAPVRQAPAPVSTIKKEASLPPLKQGASLLFPVIEKKPPQPIILVQPTVSNRATTTPVAPTISNPPSNGSTESSKEPSVKDPEIIVKTGELEITESNRPQFKVVGKIELTP